MQNRRKQWLIQHILSRTGLLQVRGFDMPLGTALQGYMGRCAQRALFRTKQPLIHCTLGTCAMEANWQNLIIDINHVERVQSIATQLVRGLCYASVFELTFHNFQTLKIDLSHSSFNWEYKFAEYFKGQVVFNEETMRFLYVLRIIGTGYQLLW